LAAPYLGNGRKRDQAGHENDRNRLEEYFMHKWSFVLLLTLVL
jgi:hypothetical protein